MSDKNLDTIGSDGLPLEWDAQKTVDAKGTYILLLNYYMPE